MRAIIYCRVSSDPNQRGKSVDEQERECRALADRSGWTVGEVLIDNDRGASRYSHKTRPAYQRLQQILSPGDVLVTWEASRAQRDLKAYVELRDLCAERGVMWSYSGRTYDLARGDDRFTTGLDALLAEKEVEQSRERVLRSVRANAAAGRPHGKLPYGYKIIRDPDTGIPVDRVPNPETAPIVQEAARRVLAGDAIYAVCADLNERGIPGPRPKRDGSKAPWIPVTMRKILESPTYAALRVHKGEVVGDATWEPIISREDHQRLVALFADPSRLTHRGAEPKWLLTGVAVCGECGGAIRRQKNRGFDAYLCKDAFHVSRNVVPVDEYVTEAVIRRLESQALLGDLADANTELRAAMDHARGLQQRLDSFTDSAADGELSAAALARIEAKLRPQIAAAEARVRSFMPSPQVADIAGPGARERWLELTIKDRRELLAQIVVVHIHSVNGKRGRPIAEGIELTWRQ
ncbi:recombinase family protein [Gordonia sp. ABSL11-1]|uniref:recombinase family protein n=1 Tax=Gordonia sp. ABSL11-1 TaxID=3053924 RepID=UPI00257326D9|nr:recombinase family protein [Gordonia sp. ABSL11-1]MDL9944221.1 recombinase family protein [Gordonia sp. ABSL11-1]